MAKLKAKTRNKLPAAKFGLPGAKGKAKARATQMVAKGRLSPEQANKIKHKADAVLGKHDCSYHNVG